jgi:hypothetical protein
LRGGLGNQLFEYAAARALALRNQVPLRIDAVTGFENDPYGRFYELSSFKILEGCETPTPACALRLRPRLVGTFLRRSEQWRMKSLSKYYDPAVYNLRVIRPFLYEFYSQSYLYFNDIAPVIRSEFEFKVIPTGLNPDLLQGIGSSNSVCLHIRRLHGKLANGSRPQAAASYYGESDLDYYRQAIRALECQHGHLSIFVFSDDAEWARQNIALFASQHDDVLIVDEPDTMRSFYLMRLCRHFIIANSTFSWWAAWLGKFPAKTVCVPPVWNRGERRFPRDLFPPGWNLLTRLPRLGD